MFKNRLTLSYIILPLLALHLPTFAKSREKPKVTTNRFIENKQRAYTVTWFVLDEGGRTDDATSASYGLKNSIGQSVIGKCESTSYKAWIGFWSAKPLWVVGVEEEFANTGTLPQVYNLSQNYPNPMSCGTTIRYSLPRAGRVELKVYNIYGQLIKTLVNELQKAGYYAVGWDGRDNAGKEVSNGIYLYRLEAGSYTETRKVILVR